MKKLLGLDIGTSSIKAVLFDENFNQLADYSEPYDVLRPKENWAEIDANAIFSSVITAVKSLSERAGFDGLAAIGIDVLCPGLVALGEDLKPLINPILYCDRRSVGEAKRLVDEIGEDVLFEITANKVMAGAISSTSMLWIKNNMPEVYERTRFFGHLNTMLSGWMTGCAAIDPSNASYTGLFETSGGKKWSKKLCDSAGIPLEKLPKILESTAVCGLVNNRELIDAGIPAGTPLVLGGSDTACAAIACGAIHSGDVFESVGTTDVLTVCVDKPVFCREYINRYHVYPDKWIYQGAMSNAGFAQEWCISELCGGYGLSEKDAAGRYEAYEREAASAEPGASGVVFLPYLTGERSPVWDSNARGVFFGIGRDTERADLVRAVAESSGYAAKGLIKIYEEKTGCQFSEINMVGGASISRMLAQLRADITRKRVNVLKKGSSALGAAILASVGCGMYGNIDEAIDGRIEQNIIESFEPTSDECAVRIYEERFEKYSRIYPSVKDLF